MRHHARLAAVLIALLLVSVLHAATPPPRAYLPTVANGAVPAATLTTLLDCNCAGVSSTLLPDGRVLLTFQDHTRGSHVFTAIDGGDHLIDVILLPFAQATLDTAASAPDSPAFQFPGPKQAPGSAIVVGGEVRWYVPSRNDDDPSGWARLKRLTMPLASLQPP